MKKIKVIGLTGQSGAGKTTTSSYLYSKGLAVIDADKISREVLNTSECKKQISDFFGKEVFWQDGDINRKKLAKKAFSSTENTKMLNKITHPMILEKIQLVLKEYKLNHDRIVLDVPLLFETELDKICDVVIAVLADENLRKQRIIKRENIDFNTAKMRLNIQKEDEFYKRRADFIIFNDSTKKALFEKLDYLLEKLK